MSDCIHRWLVSNPTAGFYVGARCKVCDAIRVLPSDTDVRSKWRLNRKRQERLRAAKAAKEVSCDD